MTYLKKNTVFAAVTIAFMMSISQAQIKYPATKKVTQTDNYFGTVIADPYRWLEDDKSDETKAWVKDQNKVTDEYLSKIPYRAAVKKRLEEMWNYTKYSSPFKEGDYYYFYKNDGLQNQSVLYRQIGLQGPPEVFIDANSMSNDGTVVPGVPSFTKSAKYCAYLLSSSGSDWQEAYIMDVKTKQLLPDKLQWIKFSGISWKGDEGFFYSRYPKEEEKNLLSKKNEFHKLYYHQIGTPQAADKIIFEDNTHPLRTITGGLTEDYRFLIVNMSEGTSGVELWVKDMLADSPFSLLIKGFNSEADVIDNDADRLLVKTTIDAPNYKLVSIDPKNPAKENWIEIIPAQNKLLESIGTAGKKLLATYLENASSRVYQYDYKGNLEKEIKLPGLDDSEKLRELVNAHIILSLQPKNKE